MTRSARILALLAIAAAALTAGAGQARAATIPTINVPWCGGGVTTRCIVSATDNGVPFTSGDPTRAVQASRYSLGGARYYSVQLDMVGGGWLLDPTHTYAVTINTGAMYPWETFARGTDIDVDRGGSAVSRTVRITMRPTRMNYTDSGCGGSGVCPAIGQHLATGYWEAVIDDAGFADTDEYRNSLRGFDLASNTDWISSPLQLDFATNTIKLDVANAHFEPDGTTVFLGHAQFTLPNAMLSGLYNVDAPGTLTPAAFGVTGAGGASTTTVAINPGSVTVKIDGMTFSKHRLRIIGRTYPRRPRTIVATRTSSTSGTLTTSPARARGSRVRGYVATCRGAGHRVVGKTSDRRGRARIHVRGLMAGQAYRCGVQAKSRAGRSKMRVVMLRS